MPQLSHPVKLLIVISTVVVLLITVLVLTFEVLRRPAPTGPSILSNMLLGDEVSFTLQPELRRDEMETVVGDAFGWNVDSRQQFSGTFVALQWDHNNDALLTYVSDTLALNEAEQQTFLSFGPSLLRHDVDLLEYVYTPNTYTFARATEPRVVAEQLLLTVTAEPNEFAVPEIAQYVSQQKLERLREFLDSELELLPDLVPLPPLDVSVKEEGGKDLLVFTTVYFNQGQGDLELRADPSTINTPGDIVRDVNQRIYRADGTFRERAAGSFQWHHSHLHYHFVDFVSYTLQAVEVTGIQGTNQLLASQDKSTFCVRDVSRVSLPNTTAADAKYEICGRERQGVSVGWGDAYFSTYPDQNIDITGLETGVYRLIFFVNPDDLFEEESTDNNTSSMLFSFDEDTKEITIVETNPTTYPEFEHINVKDTYVPSN